VGKLLGSAALGLYQMAFRISNISATEVTHVISQVTFPVYAKLQDNVPELRNAYLKVLQVTAFLSFPIGVLLLILAPDFTRVFLGDKWMPMVRAIQVLCIFGVIRSLAATCGPLFSGTNNPRFTTITSFIKLIFLAILIYPLTRKWGITGTALATTLPSLLVSQFYLVSRVAHILQCRLRDFAISIYPPVVGSILVLIFSCIIKRLSLSNVPTFAINFIAGIIIYTAFMFIFSRWYKEYNIIKVVANMIRNLR
jgi:O-antigen/teichoic acid export membrane protein